MDRKGRKARKEGRLALRQEGGPFNFIFKSLRHSFSTHSWSSPFSIMPIAFSISFIGYHGLHAPFLRSFTPLNNYEFVFHFRASSVHRWRNEPQGDWEIHWHESLLLRQRHASFTRFIQSPLITQSKSTLVMSQAFWSIITNSCGILC